MNQGGGSVWVRPSRSLSHCAAAPPAGRRQHASLSSCQDFHFTEVSQPCCPDRLDVFMQRCTHRQHFNNNHVSLCFAPQRNYDSQKFVFGP